MNSCSARRCVDRIAGVLSDSNALAALAEQHAHCELVCLTDEDYPLLLSEIVDPPTNSVL